MLKNSCLEEEYKESIERLYIPVIGHTLFVWSLRVFTNLLTLYSWPTYVPLFSASDFDD